MIQDNYRELLRVPVLGQKSSVHIIQQNFMTIIIVHAVMYADGFR